MSKILEMLNEKYPKSKALKVDGFDDAIIGYDINQEKLIYSYTLIIEILMGMDMTEEEAMEYFDYNIGGAYVGEHTPIYRFEEVEDFE